MEPEHGQEEGPERVKHLYEKVPPQSDIERQVRERELYPVGRGKELPRAGHKVRNPEQENQDARDHFPAFRTENCAVDLIACARAAADRSRAAGAAAPGGGGYMDR